MHEQESRVGADEAFYRRHYRGGVQAGSTPLAEFEREMFAPGKRYSLVVDHLTAENSVGRTFAEIGCGGAEALKLISDRYRFERHIGVDVAAAPETADIWRESRIQILNGNLNDRWPFEDGEIDCLVAMMVIEHLFDPFHAFQELKRCLSRRGTAYVNLPLVTAVRNRMRLLFGDVPVTSTGYPSWFADREWDGNHLHYFSMRSIHDLSHACELRVSEVRGVGRFHKWKSRLPGLLASEVTFRLEHV